MNRIIFLSVIISLSFLSCEKEQITSKTSSKAVKTSTSDTKGLHCSPWRDATDINAAVIDLDAVGVCNTTACNGGTTTYSHLNNMYVRDGSGAVVHFLALMSVPIADQNAIWSNAVSQAVANTPTGYTLSNIGNFRTEGISNPFLNYRVKFDIIYIKCTGGGGGES